MVKIPITEVPEKRPDLVLRFERETGTKAILKNGKITGQFKVWLRKKIKEKNKKLNEKNKPPKPPINNPYNHILLEFFLDFLNEHTYFAKNTLVGIYIQKAHPSVDEFDEIRRKFGTIIRQHVKIGVLEKYSYRTFKINKDMLEKIVNINKIRVEA